MVKAIEFLKKAGKQLVSDVAGGLDLLSSVFINPVETVSALVKGDAKGVVAAVEKTKEQPLSTNIKKTVVNTAVAAGTVYVAALGTSLAVGSIVRKGGVKYTVGAGGILTEAGKSIAKKAAAPAATVATLAVLAPKTTSKVLSTPGGKETVAATLVGGPIAGAVVGLEKGTGYVTEAIKESSTATKVALGVAGGAAVVAGGAAIVNKLKGDKGTVLETEETVKETVTKEKELGKEEEPVLPATTNVTSSKTSYKRRRRKKKPEPRQNIRINILNRPVTTGLRITNKRYIKNELLN